MKDLSVHGLAVGIFRDLHEQRHPRIYGNPRMSPDCRFLPATSLYHPALPQKTREIAGQAPCAERVQVIIVREPCDPVPDRSAQRILLGTQQRKWFEHVYVAGAAREILQGLSARRSPASFSTFEYQTGKSLRTRQKITVSTAPPMSQAGTAFRAATVTGRCPRTGTVISWQTLSRAFPFVRSR